jgi:hypothetical protein
LESQVVRPVGVENEYGRIQLEQGIIGLLLWLSFGVWFATNRAAFVKDEWFTGRRMAWYLSVFSLATAAIGVGMLSSIPNSFLFTLALGWAAVRPVEKQKNFVRIVGTPPLKLALANASGTKP